MVRVSFFLHQHLHTLVNKPGASGMSHRLAVMSQWCSDVTGHAVVMVTVLRPHSAEKCTQTHTHTPVLLRVWKAYAQL